MMYGKWYQKRGGGIMHICKSKETESLNGYKLKDMTKWVN
jgi:hypothetical protein